VSLCGFGISVIIPLEIEFGGSPLQFVFGLRRNVLVGSSSNVRKNSAVKPCGPQLLLMGGL
jgi:hypothetical protein